MSLIEILPGHFMVGVCGTDNHSLNRKKYKIANNYKNGGSTPKDHEWFKEQAVEPDHGGDGGYSQESSFSELQVVQVCQEFEIIE